MKLYTKIFLLIWVFFYIFHLSEFHGLTRFCNDAVPGNKYQDLVNQLADVDRNFLSDSIFFTAKKFAFEYRPYCFLENPLSVVFDHFHWGVAQITDTRFLYEHSSRAFCGQQSMFMADLALHFQIPYRYVHFGNHVAIELFHGNKWKYYDPTGAVYFNQNGDRASFQELRARGDIVIQAAQKQPFDQLEILPENHNFFHRLQWFNTIALLVWWFSLPVVLLWTFRNKWLKIIFK